MKFSKLARLFSELESTTKRLEMIDILSTFFIELNNSKNFDDLDKIIYLLQGQLASNIKQYEIPKMGVAEKMIIKVLKDLSQRSDDFIKNSLRKTGDIGSTAELVLSKPKSRQDSITKFIDYNQEEKSSIEIAEVYNQLIKLAKTEGSGS